MSNVEWSNCEIKYPFHVEGNLRNWFVWPCSTHSRTWRLRRVDLRPISVIILLLTIILAILIVELIMLELIVTPTLLCKESIQLRLQVIKPLETCLWLGLLRMISSRKLIKNALFVLKNKRLDRMPVNWHVDTYIINSASRSGLKSTVLVSGNIIIIICILLLHRHQFLYLYTSFYDIRPCM